MNEQEKEIITKKFLNNLVVPSIRTGKQIFFCPVGLVGAGKTTFTKPISEALHLLRISSDELRKILKESGFDYSALKDILFPIVSDYINQGYSIALDMDCGNPETKKMIDTISQEKGIRVFWVHINSPEEYIIDKLSKHPPTWLADDPQIMIDNYYAQKEKRLKENTKFNFDFVFDATKSIQDQVEQFVVYVKKVIAV